MRSPLACSTATPPPALVNALYSWMYWLYGSTAFTRDALEVVPLLHGIQEGVREDCREAVPVEVAFGELKLDAVADFGSGVERRRCEQRRDEDVLVELLGGVAIVRRDLHRHIRAFEMVLVREVVVVRKLRLRVVERRREPVRQKSDQLLGRFLLAVVLDLVVLRLLRVAAGRSAKTVSGSTVNVMPMRGCQ